MGDQAGRALEVQGLWLQQPTGAPRFAGSAPTKATALQGVLLGDLAKVTVTAELASQVRARRAISRTEIGARLAMCRETEQVMQALRAVNNNPAVAQLHITPACRKNKCLIPARRVECQAKHEEDV